ncbi:MAG: SGNH/GDSL hydrolase family protein [Eubacteriaceae bacterium]
MKKRVLCYGDSNTWGYIPGTGLRYDDEIRWTGVLREKLGIGFTVIEEGLNGRTTVYDDPFQSFYCRNGKTFLPTVLMTHKPLDIIIFMLGTNDLKSIYNANPYDIAKGMSTLINIVKYLSCGRLEQAPKIIVVSPPSIEEMTEFASQFIGAKEKIKYISEEYNRISNELGCIFYNATKTIKGSKIDGLHLEEAEHKKLGEEFACLILN